jgi:GT2 family glycosyltransferase
MVRLHLKGYKFVLVLNSIVYHMGSLTSRGTEESTIAHDTTHKIFVKKWKIEFEYFKRSRIKPKKIRTTYGSGLNVIPKENTNNIHKEKNNTL